ncbi:MAG: uroporphyrinogen-III synthase [Solitalea-like symbiont of Acarus siro]
MDNTKTKVKNILITQPKLENSTNQYSELSKKYDLNIDFESLVHIENVSGKEFRKEKKNLAEYTAIIFTSKIAIDHYFRLCEELRYELSDDSKYFCASGIIALYLQKYINYRKRKVFFPKKETDNLKSILSKYKNEKFLFPCSDFHKETTIVDIRNAGFSVDEAIIYRIVCSDIPSIGEKQYDLVVLFSPYGVRSLLKNFPNFSQQSTKIAAFGKATHEAVTEAGLVLDIKVPTIKTPSMAKAIEEYLRQENK